MNFPKQITASQVMVIISNTVIGVSVLALPRIASEQVNTGGFLVTILGILGAFIGIFVIAKLGARFPTKTFVEYSAEIIGRPISRFFSLLIIIYFVLLEGLVTREFAEVMNHTLLEETPIFVTITSFIIVLAITSRNSMTTFSHIQFYYFPFIIIPIILMALFSISKMEIIHLKPFFGNNAQVMNFVDGTITVAGLPFIQIGIFVLAVVIPFMEAAKRAILGSLLGIVISGITMLFAVSITMAVFGTEELEKSMWPMLVMTRMIQFPADMLERVDIVFLLVWIFSAFTTLLSGYVIIAFISGKLFGFDNHLPFTFTMVPFIVGVALYCKNIHQMYEYMKVIGKYGLLLTIVYPTLLLILSVVRKKKEVSK